MEDEEESGDESMLEGIDQDSDESEAAAARGLDDLSDSDDEKKALKKKSGKKALRA